MNADLLLIGLFYMKQFFQGSLFGLLFSAAALWLLKFSPWAWLPELKASVFLIGGGLLGGFINLLIGEVGDVPAKQDLSS